MSINKSFWRRWIEGNTKEAQESPTLSNENASSDALEEGLKPLSWMDSGRASVQKLQKKTRETLGEEVGNTITHGVMALFILFMLPYSAIRSYVRAPEGYKNIDAFGVSVFLISIFLMFLASTIYHSMSYGTKHKGVTNRLDHMMIYVAIAGSYTPICLSIIGGTLGVVLTIVQWLLVICGILFKSLAFSKSLKSYILTICIYLIMGWMVMLCMPSLIEGATAPAFWLIVTGGIFYTLGVIVFAMKFRFAHMTWHFFVNFGALSHLIAIVFFLR